MSLLQDDQIDFAVVGTKQMDTDQFNYLAFPEKDIWGLLIPVDSPAVHLSKITPADLSGLDLLVNEYSFNFLVSSWMNEYAGKIRIAGYVDLPHNAAWFVKKIQAD